MFVGKKSFQNFFKSQMTKKQCIGDFEELVDGFLVLQVDPEASAIKILSDLFIMVEYPESCSLAEFVFFGLFKV